MRRELVNKRFIFLVLVIGMLFLSAGCDRDIRYKEGGKTSGGDVLEDICIPNCEGKECGDDGCGGICGSCGINSICAGGKCGCQKGYINCSGIWSWRGGCETANSDPQHLWSKGFGGSSDDYGYSVSVDSNGNVYITGEFYSSSIDFGGGKLKNAGGNCDFNKPCSDIFLAKFDKEGNHIWSKMFGGDRSDGGNSVSVSVDSSGNVYITGSFGSSIIDFGGDELKNPGIFLAKFDTNGNHIWSKKFDGNGSVSSINIDSNGNVYITGWFYLSSIDFGGGALTNAGGLDIFLAKFDSNGNHLWSKRFGEGNWDRGNSVSVDSNGNVYITGEYDKWNSSGPCRKGQCDPYSTTGHSNIFLAKFDRDGNFIWIKIFYTNLEPGSQFNYGNSVSVDKSGDVYIVGEYESYRIDLGGGELKNAGGRCVESTCPDIFLAKFDSNGNHIWSKRFGGSDYDWGSSVSVDTSGSVYITGYFSSSIDLGGGETINPGIFIAKFDSNGNHIWSKSLGGEYGDNSNSISVDSSGNVYLTGYFYSSTINFGGCTFNNAGAYDIFLLKYAP